jgi:hypothetical protein
MAASGKPLKTPTSMPSPYAVITSRGRVRVDLTSRRPAARCSGFWDEACANALIARGGCAGYHGRLLAHRVDPSGWATWLEHLRTKPVMWPPASSTAISASTLLKRFPVWWCARQCWRVSNCCGIHELGVAAINQTHGDGASVPFQWGQVKRGAKPASAGGAQTCCRHHQDEFEVL